ncbi:unnamed protein product [Effrenium voratum]|nr:unnamed protein product [Effrenium voratum]
MGPEQPLSVPVTVSIPRTETGRGFLGVSTALYVVEVRALDESHELHLPFEDFEKVHADFAQLFKSFPSEVRKKLSYALPPLPGVTWYAYDSPRTLDDRRQKLDALLQGLLQQREVLQDADERLWRFLQLGQAVRAALRLLVTGFVDCKLLQELQGDPKALRHSMVEDALLQILEDCQESKVESVGCSDVCNTLARLYADDCGACLAATRASAVQKRRVRLLLASEGQAGSDALLALARSDQLSWQEALAANLSTGVLELFTEAAEASSEPLAELLLRGFDGAVVSQFVDSSLTQQRKSLLNAYYCSDSSFVRLLSGLILAKLLTHGGLSDAEEAQAEAGLMHLSSPDGDNSLDFGDDPPTVLAEEPMWAWFCQLLTCPKDAGRGFALKVLATLREERRAAQNPSVLRSVLDLTQIGTFRGQAAEIVLKAWQDPEVQVNTWDDVTRDDLASISAALAQRADSALSTHGADLAELLAFLAQLQRRHLRLATLAETSTSETTTSETETSEAPSCGTAVERRMAALAGRFGPWRQTLQGTAAALALAELQNGEAHEALARLGAKTSEASNAMAALPEQNNALKSAKAEALQSMEAVRELSHDMELLLKEKMQTTQEASESAEEAKRWRAAAAEAEEREAEWSAGNQPTEFAPDFDKLQKAIASGEKALAEPSAQECWSRHQEAIERMKSTRDKVANVDARLRHASDLMPALQADLERCRQRSERLEEEARDLQTRRQEVMKNWGEVAMVTLEVGGQVLQLRRRLQEVQAKFAEETSCRLSLQLAARDLQRALVGLEEHLEDLAMDSEAPSNAELIDHCQAD